MGEPERASLSAMPAADQQSDEDDVLIVRAQRDPRAFAPLYTRYAKPIYRYCYRRLGSRELAEDATSRVFMQTLRALPRYQSGSFRSWLFTIAHNVVTDTYRRQRPSYPLEAAHAAVDPALTPEEAAVRADDHRALRSLMEQLPAAQRQVLEFRLAGLSGPEIAEVLGRSVGAVRMLQFRAVERLRELLGGDPPADAEEVQNV